MRVFVVAVALIALSGCAGGVSTGRKSDCFNTARTDGTYVAQGSVIAVSTKGAEVGDDCSFRPL